jgi:hypothetical protein
VAPVEHGGAWASAGLEDRERYASLGEVRGGGQPDGSSADDHHREMGIHWLASSFIVHRRSAMKV